MMKQATEQPAQTAPRYRRAKEIAQHLCISQSTLWHWAKYRPGFPQPIKAGARVTLFDLDAIEAFLTSKQREGQA